MRKRAVRRGGHTCSARAYTRLPDCNPWTLSPRSLVHRGTSAAHTLVGSWVTVAFCYGVGVATRSRVDRVPHMVLEKKPYPRLSKIVPPGLTTTTETTLELSPRTRSQRFSQARYHRVLLGTERVYRGIATEGLCQLRKLDTSFGWLSRGQRGEERRTGGGWLALVAIARHIHRPRTCWFSSRRRRATHCSRWVNPCVLCCVVSEKLALTAAPSCAIMMLARAPYTQHGQQ